MNSLRDCGGFGGCSISSDEKDSKRDQHDDDAALLHGACRSVPPLRVNTAETCYNNTHNLQFHFKNYD